MHFRSAKDGLVEKHHCIVHVSNNNWQYLTKCIFYANHQAQWFSILVYVDHSNAYSPSHPGPPTPV